MADRPPGSRVVVGSHHLSAQPHAVRVRVGVGEGPLVGGMDSEHRRCRRRAQQQPKEASVKLLADRPVTERQFDDEECAVGKRQASKGKKRSRGWGHRVTPVWLIARRLGLRGRGGGR